MLGHEIDGLWIRLIFGLADVYDIDDVLVLELTQKFDFTEDALRIHNIFECPGNFFNSNFSARFYIERANHHTISAAAHWAN